MRTLSSVILALGTLIAIPALAEDKPTAPAKTDAKTDAKAGADAAPKQAAPTASDATTPPKECWGIYELKSGSRSRTLTYPAAPKPVAAPAQGTLLDEQLKATAAGGCEIMVFYDVGPSPVAEPITERYNLTVTAKGTFSGTLTVTGDGDSKTTNDKPKVTKLRGTRKPASK